MKKYNTEYLIIGAGIIGLSIAYELKKQNANCTIIILEKESDAGFHSSGRNSGVLHAGFYYTKDSLKAKFTKEGNERLTKLCEDNNLKINKAGKVVVAQNEKELETLFELKKRGDNNNVETYMLNEKELKKYEPNAKTYKHALYSPTTSTIDPLEIVLFLKKTLSKKGVGFLLSEGYCKNLQNNEILTAKKNKIKFNKIINTAGLYADKIAHNFGFGKKYTIIPFKGIYLVDKTRKTNLKKNIYPVPNISNPFLGVHFTVAVDGKLKLGPTAIPAFWRENYNGFKNFKLGELITILGWEAILFLSNAFDFRKLAFEEMRKYVKNHFVNLAKPLVENISLEPLNTWTKPGIRAQLLDKKTKELLQDFVVEGDENSIHVLNAVSPAFTACLPFAEYVIDNFISKK